MPILYYCGTQRESNRGTFQIVKPVERHTWRKRLHALSCQMTTRTFLSNAILIKMIDDGSDRDWSRAVEAEAAR